MAKAPEMVSLLYEAGWQISDLTSRFIGLVYRGQLRYNIGKMLPTQSGRKFCPEIVSSGTMTLVNYGSKEITYKVVYYGCGLGGKTTSVQQIHGMLAPSTRGDLISLATETERTLYFDYMPVDLGLVNGFKVKLSLYTVPGQPEYNRSRRLILQNVDALVFVADSGPDRVEDNLTSLLDMIENLSTYGFKPGDVPWVMQYNKRDLRNALSIDTLEDHLNSSFAVPWYESIAIEGKGVFAALKGVTKLAIERSGNATKQV